MAGPLINQLEDKVSTFSFGQEQILKEMEEMFAAMNTRFGRLVARRSHDIGEIPYNQTGWSADSGGPSHTFAPKLTKLDFLRFDGSEDLTSWICRAEQFFEFQGSLSIGGAGPIVVPAAKDRWLSWDILKEGLQARYGPNQYEDFFGVLVKLRQTGIVKEYKSQFESLLSRAWNLM